MMGGCCAVRSHPSQACRLTVSLSFLTSEERRAVWYAAVCLAVDQPSNFFERRWNDGAKWGENSLSFSLSVRRRKETEGKEETSLDGGRTGGLEGGVKQRYRNGLFAMQSANQADGCEVRRTSDRPNIQRKRERGGKAMKPFFICVFPPGLFVRFSILRNRVAASWGGW